MTPGSRTTSDVGDAGAEEGAVVAGAEPATVSDAPVDTGGPPQPATRPATTMATVRRITTRTIEDEPGARRRPGSYIVRGTRLTARGARSTSGRRVAR